MKKIVLVVFILLLYIDVVISQNLNINYVSVTTGITTDNNDKWRYSPYKALDGDETTAFAMPANDMPYPGRMFRVSFTDRIYINEIRIKAGYFDKRYYNENYRIKKLKLLFNESHKTKDMPEIEESFNLRDEMVEQIVKLSKPVRCDEIFFIAEELYATQKYKDVCIADLSFYINGYKYENNITANLSYRTYSYDNEGNLISGYLRGDHINYEISYMKSNDNVLIGKAYDEHADAEVIIDEIYPLDNNYQKKILNGTIVEDFYDSNNRILKTIITRQNKSYSTHYYYKDGKLCGNDYGEYIYDENELLVGFLAYDYYISNYEPSGLDFFCSYFLEYDNNGRIKKINYQWFYGFSGAY